MTGGRAHPAGPPVTGDVHADTGTEVLVITGMSGAGRSTAADALEDLDWFVVDNLPAGLLASVADLAGRMTGVPRIAAVVDVRSRAFTVDLRSAVEDLTVHGARPRVVFLEASDDTLVRRFGSVRRPHPLQGGARLVDGIAWERELLREVRGSADLIIDTSDLNVHELREKVVSAFGAPGALALRATVVSFGYKYGLPVDADLVVDCRFLPNPHWLPELSPLSGLEEPVRSYVLSQPGCKEFLDAYSDVLRHTVRGYEREGKHFVTLAAGCTGGKHRSVTMAEELAARLGGEGAEVQVVHRDLGRE